MSNIKTTRTRFIRSSLFVAALFSTCWLAVATSSAQTTAATPTDEAPAPVEEAAPTTPNIVGPTGVTGVIRRHERREDYQQEQKLEDLEDLHDAVDRKPTPAAAREPQKAAPREAQKATGSKADGARSRGAAPGRASKR